MLFLRYGLKPEYDLIEVFAILKYHCGGKPEAQLYFVQVFFQVRRGCLVGG